MLPLTLGFSPCPNDTFIFHALVHGEIETEGFSFAPRLLDVENLNQLALNATLDVSKVSYGALPYLLDKYTLLSSGGAMGRGCGPLIVTRRPLPPQRLADATIAIPGRLTTANLLLRLFCPVAKPGIEMEYHRIMPAVQAGEVDAGLIIHESRFTFRDFGLTQIADLGEWWESVTGGPIPLGAIVARRSLGDDTIRNIDRLIRRSVSSAMERPERSAEYVRARAQEMSQDVTRRHIDLYVNDYTLDLGPAGEDAIRELMRRAASVGIAGPTRLRFLSDDAVYAPGRTRPL